MAPIIERFESQQKVGAERRLQKAAYRERNRVERLINRLKQFRRIATRYEKRAANYLTIVHLGIIMLWLLRFADTA